MIAGNIVPLRTTQRRPRTDAEAELTRMFMIGTFLRRRIHTSRIARTVSISFETELEAEQFQKIVARMRRNT